MTEQLVGRARAKSFRKKTPPRDGFVHRITSDLFERLRAIPELRDGHALTNAFVNAKHESGSVEVFSPPAPGAKRLRVRVPIKKLAQHYDAGFYLHFAGIDHFVAPLREIGHTLERELDLPADSFAVNAFATKTANVAEPHFDPVTTFHIQLEGTKTWWLAPPQATEVFPLGIEGRPLPPGAVRHDIEPGTLVYLPPGFIHATEMAGPSLGLLFVASGQNLADRIASDVLKRLHREADLRAPSLYRSARQRRMAAETLRALADDLSP